MTDSCEIVFSQWSQWQKFVADFGVRFIFQKSQCQSRSQRPKTIWRIGPRIPRRLTPNWLLGFGFGIDFLEFFKKITKGSYMIERLLTFSAAWLWSMISLSKSEVNRARLSMIIRFDEFIKNENESENKSVGICDGLANTLFPPCRWTWRAWHSCQAWHDRVIIDL